APREPKVAAARLDRRLPAHVPHFFPRAVEASHREPGPAPRVFLRGSRPDARSGRGLEEAPQLFVEVLVLAPAVAEGAPAPADAEERPGQILEEAQGALPQPHDPGDRRRLPLPVEGFAVELPPAPVREDVVLGAPAVLGRAPLALHEAAALEPAEGREQRAGVHPEDVAARLLDPGRDPEAVHGLE